MNIGKFEKVDLRDIWKNEASEFTTWLYENLEALSDAVEINLSQIEQERSVDNSRFSIDIFAETDNGDTVIIENQLERTDHKHLGQILTYLTNTSDCETAIWIAKDPRPEHINAITWINQNTPFNIFLVKIEAYKIDSSLPAPMFSVICKPTEEGKQLGQFNHERKEKIKAKKARRDQCDTLLVPARKDGFEKVFLGEDRWYAIRIRASRISQLKYIAAYQVAPISSVTHIAEIKEIREYKDTGKYEVIFKEPPKEFGPLPLGDDPSRSPQGPQYAEREKLERSKTLKEALSYDEYLIEKKAA
mgnify:CR=1 FL=1